MLAGQDCVERDTDAVKAQTDGLGQGRPFSSKDAEWPVSADG